MQDAEYRSSQDVVQRLQQYLKYHPTVSLAMGGIALKILILNPLSSIPEVDIQRILVIRRISVVEVILTPYILTAGTRSIFVVLALKSADLQFTSTRTMVPA